MKGGMPILLASLERLYAGLCIRIDKDNGILTRGQMSLANKTSLSRSSPRQVILCPRSYIGYSSTIIPEMIILSTNNNSER